MGINERIKMLRKDILKMSQTQFASQIGMKQTSVSTFEKPGASVADYIIKTICSAFSINEQWLREGKGPIKIPSKSFSLDSFIEEHGGTDLEIEIVKTYFELEPEIRHTILEHFKKKFISESQNTSPAAPLPTVEEAEANYIKNVLGSAQNTDSAISSSTEDVKKVSGE